MNIKHEYFAIIAITVMSVECSSFNQYKKKSSLKQLSEELTFNVIDSRQYIFIVPPPLHFP